ncbi:hypothetical protein GFS31_43700 (plasmid) [Leptolyngbya sp. BL0902]|nr:hypothetical protein GFS31_43700 [Leptolyngbya sp. BL0902]
MGWIGAALNPWTDEPTGVSIPERVWGGLELHQLSRSTVTPPGFNP